MLLNRLGKSNAGLFFCLLASLLLLLQFYYLHESRIKLSRQDRSDIIYDIFNETLGFENIFVISLPSRTDRRDGMVLAAAVSNIRLEFVDGVNGADIPDKSIPSLSSGRLKDADVGAWRGHMNAIQEIVRRNISSALILEDDVDWDVRLKEQMYNFALSSQALTQPLVDSDGFADPTYPTPSDARITPPDISFDALPRTVAPISSPFGDNWKILWPGHCGMHFPTPNSSPTAHNIPKARIIQHPDPSVPQPHHLTSDKELDSYRTQYENYTRVTHHVNSGVCTLGYAVTQSSARAILTEIGLGDLRTSFDVSLNRMCEGSDGVKYTDCVTATPGLFQHYYRAGMVGADSDINEKGEEVRRKGYSRNVRWSTRLNAGVLIDGGKEFVDQYPDEKLETR